MTVAVSSVSVCHPFEREKTPRSCLAVQRLPLSVTANGDYLIARVLGVRRAHPNGSACCPCMLTYTIFMGLAVGQ